LYKYTTDCHLPGLRLTRYTSIHYSYRTLTPWAKITHAVKSQ